MKRHGNLPRRLSALVLVAVLAPVAVADPDPTVVPGEVLVELATGVAVSEFAETHQLEVLDGIPQWRIWRLGTMDGVDAGQVVASLTGDPGVLSIEEHHLYETPEGIQVSIPDLELTAGPDDLLNQPAGQTIHKTQTQTALTGDQVVVAVLDTGISLSHPQLAGNLVDQGSDLLEDHPTAAASADGIDNDGDGIVDESLHHSTFVGGLVTLVAPDARILPLRILDAEGRGSAFSLVRGILYAIEQRVDVLNLSLALVDPSEEVDELIERAIEEAEDSGVIVVAGAGNRGLGQVDFPASVNEVIAVAAVDANLVKAEFSNYGPEIDMTAPGVDLLSLHGDSDFARWSGTSFAAPLVSGTIALLFEKYPCIDEEDVRSILLTSAQPDANPELAGLMGAGVLDVDAAVQTLAEALCLETEKGTSGMVMSWGPVLGAEAYDVIRGDVEELGALPDGSSLGAVSCVANDLPDTDTAAIPDSQVPASGQAFFYLFRESGKTDYGDDSSGASRIAMSGDCPTESP